MQRFLDYFSQNSNAFVRWLRSATNAWVYVLFLMLGVLLVSQAAGYHLAHVPQPEEDPLTNWGAHWDGSDVPMVEFVTYLLSYLRLFAWLAGLVYHIRIIQLFPDVKAMVRPTLWYCGYLAVLVVFTMFYRQWEVQSTSMTGEVFSKMAFTAHLLMMVGLVMSPPVVMYYVARCQIMERYLLRSFLQPLFFCLIAFFTLWVVMDLLDNMQDFQDHKIGTVQMFLYYVRLSPSVLVTVAPITLLLATLYTLGRMSRTNELISMLGTGKSMFEVLRPVYLVGVFVAFLSMAFNYEWAPSAAGELDQMLADSAESKKGEIRVRGLMYHNQEGNRTWFIGSIPKDFRQPNKLRRVELRQEDKNGNLVETWWGNAFWWPGSRHWTFYNGAKATYKDNQKISIRPLNTDGTVFDREDLPPEVNETPWMLMSGALTPDFLGVPELMSYIHGNSNQPSDKLASYWTHFFYRFSLPWQCLVVVMFAAPLSVVFSRRGLVGGMTSAVLFFFVMLFFDNMFLNLGKNQYLPPLIAVWTPHLLLSGVGVLLFLMRSQNREMPKLSLKALMAR